MTRKQMFAVVCLLAVFAIHAAQAAMPLTYQFKVRITQQDDEGVCPAVGSLMKISITVDRAFPVQPPIGHTETYFGGPAYDLPSPILGISINDGPSTEPIMDDIYVSKGYAGSYGYTFLGSDFSQGATITFSTTDKNLVPTYRLPPSIVPKNFSTATFVYTTKTASCTGNIVAR